MKTELMQKLEANCVKYTAVLDEHFRHTIKRTELADKLATLKEQAKAHVLFAKDDNGKDLYSNDAKREVAVTESLRTNLDYVGMKTELAELDKLLSLSAHALDKLKYEKSTLKAIVQLVAGDYQ
jgi:chorismate mutase